MQAPLKGGLFKVTVDGLREGARTLHLQYTRTDGSTVEATPIALSRLAGLDLWAQSLEFEFPDVDTADAELRVRTRQEGGA